MAALIILSPSGRFITEPSNSGHNYQILPRSAILFARTPSCPQSPGCPSSNTSIHALKLKKRLSSALSSFKDFVAQRKRPRVSLAPAEQPVAIGAPNALSACHANETLGGEASVSPLSSLLEEPVSLHNPSQDFVGVLRDHSFEEEGGGGGGGRDNKMEDMSLAQWRPRCQNRRLLQRFRDVLPQPPPTIPAEVQDRPGVSARSVFHTPPNVFGLVCQYFCAMPPSHDPEEYMTIADLSFIPEAPQEPYASNNHSLYHLYPNRSSFQLGEWYWNQGLQKSQADYTKLLDIIGTSSFSASDVTSTRWKNINSTLGVNEYDEGDGDEWQDKDAGYWSPLRYLFPAPPKNQGPGRTKPHICIIIR
ncbi:uncharacterized protein F5147DRAFT_777960 [Suillus discolor]|uniref:Uncharacterized protein n=1 Tax=Suillus discolor TaxID=1912936 RepID=A0A9P7EY23_9AGAM|nr:uncharacterized protein F5147DRAFT_777960 [Suillus discolor]KAG2097512.1 hypothetical protein F5147DRAFT_777960 [Suillus discolor]